MHEDQFLECFLKSKKNNPDDITVMSPGLSQLGLGDCKFMTERYKFLKQPFYSTPHKLLLILHKVVFIIILLILFCVCVFKGSLRAHVTAARQSF